MLSPTQLGALLEPYLAFCRPDSQNRSRLYDKLTTYLTLLLKWNDRTNLTSIRSPEEIVRRHFGESLFVGSHLTDAMSGPTNSLLDFGSGAGFPGIPIQLLHPLLNVTLAESRGKKSAFLREVTRALELPTDVWASRVQAMPAERTFGTVTLRAVDNMAAAIADAAPRAVHRLLILTTREGKRSENAEPQAILAIPGFDVASVAMPGSETGVLLLAMRQIVPRGTM